MYMAKQIGVEKSYSKRSAERQSAERALREALGATELNWEFTTKDTKEYEECNAPLCSFVSFVVMCLSGYGAKL